MRAVVLNGERDVTVEDVPDAGVPGPDGLLLRVERTAICGSDLHLYHGPMTIPGVHLGHEFVGTVEEVGGAVTTVGKGDRVLVSGVIGCGVCHGLPGRRRRACAATPAPRCSAPRWSWPAVRPRRWPCRPPTRRW